MKFDDFVPLGRPLSGKLNTETAIPKPFKLASHWDASNLRLF